MEGWTERTSLIIFERSFVVVHFIVGLEKDQFRNLEMGEFRNLKVNEFWNVHVN